MKKEMRLIDANALLEKGYWHGKHPDWENPFAEGVDAVDTIDIENAPTVDAVEVVRCKDCKHCIYISYACGDVRCRKLHSDYIKEDGFCNYGERKDNERKAD